jgi:hypothetical protein
MRAMTSLTGSRANRLWWNANNVSSAASIASAVQPVAGAGRPMTAT